MTLRRLGLWFMLGLIWVVYWAVFWAAKLAQYAPLRGKQYRATAGLSAFAFEHFMTIDERRGQEKAEPGLWY